MNIKIKDHGNENNDIEWLFIKSCLDHNSISFASSSEKSDIELSGDDGASS